MRYTTLPRTATFAWSPSTSASSPTSPTSKTNESSPCQLGGPLLATGTASGALDASFSTDSALEIWSPFSDQNGAPVGSVTVTSRFNRVAWGEAAGLKPQGVIAAGMENAQLDIWDPVKIMAGDSNENCLVSKMTNHAGPVKGLDFNPIKHNLLASGATKGEVFIWDLNHPVKPFAPPPSRSLDEVTSVSWNYIVQSVLAASSNNGYAVVWDIREANGQKGREVAALSYNGSVNPIPGYGQPQPGMASGPQYGSQWMGSVGGRPGSVSSVVWHPENPTKLATCSEDDASPIVLVWDLRNARAPEKILSGHEKGILNLAWCSRDSDLLLSCGKDCRTICWNPSSGEIVAELPSSSNWSFQSTWCPKNPNLVATASFDGRIAIHSIQSTGDQSDASHAQPSAGPPADGSDIFGDQGIIALNSAQAAVSLKQTPKWYRRPASVTFTFGGRLVMFFNSGAVAPDVPRGPGAESQPEVNHRTVTIKQVVTEPFLVQQALRLENASQSCSLQGLCEERAKHLTPQAPEAEVQNWKLLLTFFKTEFRNELVTLLGFSKDEVRALVERQIETHKVPAKRPSAPSRGVSEAGPTPAIVENNHSDNESIPRESLVTFADTPVEGRSASSEGGGEAAASSAGADPSENSVSAISEGTKLAEAESEITEPSLFGDDNANAAGQTAASLDFYNSMGSSRPAALPEHVYARVGGATSSVVATIGSRASSVASENMRTNTFQIYPKDESKVDRLITRALVLGDFDSAVSLCISAERFADAILLGVKGGPKLLQKAQKAYFAQQTPNLPYLRLYQSIVLDDLSDIVQNAAISEWREVFAILCNFAKNEEFAHLTEQLGQRLEHLAKCSAPVEGQGSTPNMTEEHCKNAILCYMAAGKLEKVVGIWIEQMKEEESKQGKDLLAGDSKCQVTLHAEVLQAFIEKVTIFQSAINYIDLDLAQPSEAAARSEALTYKLAPLYDCYCEYAELLASQGLVNTALRFISQTPLEYAVSCPAFSTATRERLAKYIGVTSIVATSHLAPEQKTPTSTAMGVPLEKPFAEAPTMPAVYRNPYNNMPASQQQYSAYNPPTGLGEADRSARPGYGNPYESPYGRAPGPIDSGYAPVPGGAFLPPPPVPLGASQAPNRATSTSQPPPRPPQVSRPVEGNAGGWNDAPAVNPPRKTGAAASAQKLVITSPFPNASQPISTRQVPLQSQFGGYDGPSTNIHQGPPNVPLPPPRSHAHISGQAAPPPPKSGQLLSGAGPQPVQQHSYAPTGPYGGQPVPGSTQSPAAGFYTPQAGIAASQGYGSVPGPYTTASTGVNLAPSAQPVGYGTQPSMQPAMQQPAGLPSQPSQVYSQQQHHLPGQQQAPYTTLGGPGNYVPRPSALDGASSGTTHSTPAKPELPKPKYPCGDRSHIPDASKPIYLSLQRLMNQMKQALPGQKKMVSDTERRLNVLFDALNCDTVPQTVVDELLDIVKAIEVRNLQLALQLHVSLLTSGVKSEELATYMPAIKMLITKLQ